MAALTRAEQGLGAAAVLHQLGWIVAAYGVVMLAPAPLALVRGETAALTGMLGGAGTAIFVGIVALFATSGGARRLKAPEGVALAIIAWPACALFGALPLYASTAFDSLDDAMFEAVSALTTTGLTVLPDPRILDDSLLLWRAMMQWLGGGAAITFAVLILPTFGAGGVGPAGAGLGTGASESRRPWLRLDLLPLWFLYSGLTALCTMLLWLSGLAPLDGVCIAMSTLSTGGFTVGPESVPPGLGGYGRSVLLVFMIVGATSFLLHLRAARRGALNYARDPEMSFYLGSIAVAILLMVSLHLAATDLGVARALLDGIFVAVSALTTTGFALPDSASSHSTVVLALFLLALVGGTTGSAAGGFKALRARLLLQQGAREMTMLIRPHAVVPIKLARVRLPELIVQNAWAFLVGFVFLLILLASGLAAVGVDFRAALSLAIAATTNTGPLLVGGQAMTDPTLATGAVHWLLMAGMVIGRVEILALLVVVLVSAKIWRL